MQIRHKVNSANEIAAFISKLNSMKQHHVGFIGENEQEIQESIEQEFGDQHSLGKLFTLAYDHDKLIGLIGFNADFPEMKAEIWGPYILEHQGNYQQIAGELWEAGFSKLNGQINEFHGFYNQENSNANQWMINLGAQKKSEQTILKLCKPESPFQLNHPVQEITPEYISSFIKLHDQTFPNTYYDGQEIIDKLDEQCRLFIAPVSDEVVGGYCYIEGNPAFKEGSIEFISVAEDLRQKGIGKSLLCRGLNELLFNHHIEEISLCVDASNEGALRMYESSGFTRENTLNFYLKDESGK